MTDKTCDRCGATTERLYPIYHVHCHDEQPHKYDEQYCGKPIQVCWDCDFEITNGRGDPDDDPWEVVASRWNDEYDADPIYVDPPPWRLGQW